MHRLLSIALGLARELVRILEHVQECHHNQYRIERIIVMITVNNPITAPISDNDEYILSVAPTTDDAGEPIALPGDLALTLSDETDFAATQADPAVPSWSVKRIGHANQAADGSGSVDATIASASVPAWGPVNLSLGFVPDTSPGGVVNVSSQPVG